jgi:TolB-like protein
MSQTRRLAAILAADVAGYSRLIGADEGGTLERLKSLRRELLDPKIAEHKGRLVKTTGDGLLVEFGSVVDALRCAVDVQREMTGHNAGVPPESRIEFRIGINVGDIVVEDGDIFGDGVNVAARLEALAEPGGICVSARVQEDAAGRLDLAFDDLGEQQLKNIARPIRAYRVITSARPATLQVSTDPPLPDKPSIAVLPFANMSGDPEQEYFVDGMVEEIITALSRIRWLFVIARNSSFTYKGLTVDVKQIGRELGVLYVLEGSVRKAGQRVRITGQLIDAQSGAHLWADRFDGSLEDVFELQDKIAVSVAGVIEPALQAAEMRRSAARPTADLTAYDLYLRALALNPSFARGWNVSGTLRLWAGQPDLAIEHVETSLRLSPRERMGTPLYNIGVAYFSKRRFDEAAAKLVLSIQADPGFPPSYRVLAACYAHMGRLDEARAIVARLRAIMPQIVPSVLPWRNPEDRELLLSGLRLAMGETA